MCGFNIVKSRTRQPNTVPSNTVVFYVVVWPRIDLYASSFDLYALALSLLAEEIVMGSFHLVCFE